MSFQSSLIVGDPAMDRDHATLHALIAALPAAAPEAMMEALDALRSHAAQHFASEDADLRRIGDPNASCHLDEHAAVLASLQEVRAVLADASVEAAAKERLVRRLATQLADWLPEHVQVMDAGVAATRTRERLGGVPVLISRRPAA